MSDLKVIEDLEDYAKAINHTQKKIKKLCEKVNRLTKKVKNGRERTRKTKK